MRGHPQRKSELITLYHRYLYIEKNAVWTQLGTTCSLRNPLGGPGNQPCGLEDFILHCYKIREMLWEIFDSAETGNFQECKESVHLSKLQRVGNAWHFCPLPDSCLHGRHKHLTELCLRRQKMEGICSCAHILLARHGWCSRDRAMEKLFSLPFG